MTSPAKHVDTFGYDSLSRPAVHTLTFGDTGDTFQSTVEYDKQGRPWRVTYPSEPGDGASPLQVERKYDAFGELIALYDDSTATTFWQLEELDGAGHAIEEVLGNGVSVTHGYHPASGLVEHIGAQWERNKQTAHTLQDLTLRLRRRAAHEEPQRRVAAGDGVFPARRARPAHVRGAGRPKGVVRTGRRARIRSRICRTATSPARTASGPTATIPSTRTRSRARESRRSPTMRSATRSRGRASRASRIPRSISLPASQPSAGVNRTCPLLPSCSITTATSTGSARPRGRQETVYFDDLYERVTTTATSVQQHQHFIAAGSATVVVTR